LLEDTLLEVILLGSFLPVLPFLVLILLFFNALINFVDEKAGLFS